MQKIPSVFERNYDTDGRIRNEVTPGCEWVIAGEGVATRKYDGTCCLVKDGKLYKRYDAKQGKTPPAGFIPAQEPDPVTGHYPGWLIVGDEPSSNWHRDAWEMFTCNDAVVVDGTYELCGPKVQCNPERFGRHLLVSHEYSQRLEDCPRDFDGMREFLRPLDIEGVVFHHPDGRMAKVKKRDFGLSRKPELQTA